MSLNALSLSLNSLKRSLSLGRKEVLKKSVPTGSKRITRAFKFVERVCEGKMRERITYSLLRVLRNSLTTFLSKIGLRSKNEKSLSSLCWRIFNFSHNSFKWCCLGLFTLFHAKKREKFNFRVKNRFFRDFFSFVTLELVVSFHPKG